jgi:hypothetical protein
MAAVKQKPKVEKRVRVTVELSEGFVRLLAAKAALSKWKEKALGEHGEHELDSGDVLAWLILLEARGAYESEIHAMTPMMWRNGGPELIHEERRVIEKI